MFQHKKWTRISDIPDPIREKVNLKKYYGREDYQNIRQEIKTHLQSLGYMPDVASNIAGLYSPDDDNINTEDNNK